MDSTAHCMKESYKLALLKTVQFPCKNHRLCDKPARRKQGARRAMILPKYKGQLISEWLFDVLHFPKKTTQKFDEFLP